MNDELSFNKDYQKPSKGKKVRSIQEWLCLNGIGVMVDGDFGPATDYAVRLFQREKGLNENGIVGKKTWEALTEQMKKADEHIAPGQKRLGQMVVAYARQHWKGKPREIGGQNKGPWVRLYMNGNEGPQWAWCAGFTCHILEKACHALGVPLPIRTSFSCDSLAASAKLKDRFLAESKIVRKKQITPGSFFLARRTPTDWVHTGIVIGVEDKVFHTIEGNTNDDGGREGYQVYRRVRGYKKKDFILI